MAPPWRAPAIERFSEAALLESRRFELESELRRVTAQLASVRKKERVAARRGEALTAVTIQEKVRRLILCAFWITSFVTQDCLVLLEQVRVPPLWGSLDTAGRTALVDDLFLAADLDEVETWVNPAWPENQKLLRELWILYAEWRTAKWVHHTNSVHGVAPSSAQLFAVYIEWRRKGPAEFHPRTFARTLGARRKWAMRWRRRWNGSVGHLKTGDLDPRDVLRQKALEWRAPGGPCQRCTEQLGYGSPRVFKDGPFFRSRGGTRKWSLVLPPARAKSRKGLFPSPLGGPQAQPISGEGGTTVLQTLGPAISGRHLLEELQLLRGRSACQGQAVGAHQHGRDFSAGHTCPSQGRGHAQVALSHVRPAWSLSRWPTAATYQSNLRGVCVG